MKRKQENYLHNLIIEKICTRIQVQTNNYHKHINQVLTLKRRKTFLAKLVDLSTVWAVPGSPLLKNFEPYCIALHILSLASALFRYKTTRPSSALVASSVLIFYPKPAMLQNIKG